MLLTLTVHLTTTAASLALTVTDGRSLANNQARVQAVGGNVCYQPQQRALRWW